MLTRFARWAGLAVLGWASTGFAQTMPFNGVCGSGGQYAVTSGLNSSNTLEGVVPKCLVTVVLHGTSTPATLTADSTGTTLPNPFYATTLGSAAPGSWVFWAATGTAYDVTMSVGPQTPPPATFPNGPVTITMEAGVGGGAVNSVTGDGTLYNNSASTGAVTLTLGNAAAHSVWGNATSSPASPGYTANPVVTSLTAAGSTNGYISLTSAGTPPSSAPSNTFQQTVPNSVTAYTIEWPGAQPTGGSPLLSCTAANPSVCSWAGANGISLQTNSSNNASQTLFNVETSTTNAVGLTITPSNPSGGIEKWEITGGSYTGTAVNLSGTPALPNGTTATSQAVNDATTDLATDYFVQRQLGNSLVPGAQAVYEMWKTTSGTSLPDQSGNGFNCTLGSGGSAPVWGNGALTFSPAGVSVNVTCPAGTLSGANTVMVFYAPTIPSTADVTNFEYPSMMFTDGAGYGFGQYLSRYGQIALVTTNGVTTAISEPDDRPLGNSSFSIVCPLSGNAIPYINGHGPTGMLATGGCPAFDTTGTVYIGDDTLIPGAFSWAGKIYAMLVYPTALTAQQISQNHNYITSQLAQNGVGAFVDKIAPYALIYQGDSRTANQGSQDSLTDSRGYYISQLQPGREQFYNFGVSGISLSTIISNLPMNEYPVLQTFPALSKTVLIDAGINDITNGAASGATVYGYMQTYCADIHANSPGTRVIAATIYGNAYFGNTVPIGYEVTGREAYNADLIAGALAGTLNCDGVDDEADDPIAATQISPNNFNTTASVFPTGLTNHVTPGSFNPTWTVDGIHLTGAGNKELSTLESFALLAGQGRADKCTLVNFQIPWQVVQSANAVTPSLAQTIPLTQLFTGWQMCGQPSVHVTTAYVGTTTLTISIGDSTGSATQYLGATSLKSTGTTLGSTAAFVSADGVVQLTFTATGTDLNTVSAGNAIIQIGLQVRP